MAISDLNDGVGKKIVEALKMQSDIEVATSEDSFEKILEMFGPDLLKRNPDII